MNIWDRVFDSVVLQVLKELQELRLEIAAIRQKQVSFYRVDISAANSSSFVSSTEQYVYVNTKEASCCRNYLSGE